MDDYDGVLEFPCDVERLPNGNTLITDAGDETDVGSEVIETDPQGRVVWRYGGDLKFAHSARRLKDGTTLITDTTNNRILIVGASGEMVLSSDQWGGGNGRLSDGSHLRYPNDAHCLDDGALLITDRNNNRVLIADREGNVLWSYSQGIEHPHNADLLDSGNLLICNSDANKVLEVDGQGQVVWSYGDGTRETLNFPRDADRLSNGNTLITDSRNHRVIEVTSSGEIVWEHGVDYYASFYEADRLESGNTLIADQHHHRIIEVNPEGQIVWAFRNRRQRREAFPRLRNGFFKKRGPNDQPEGWHLYNRFSEGGGRLVWDEDAPGLEFDRSGILCLVQYVEVTPGVRYTLTGRIRTREIDPESIAYFQLFFLDDHGGPVSNTAQAPKGRALTGTTDWLQDTIEAEAPSTALSVEIRLFINGPGTVWMKEVMFFS